MNWLEIFCSLAIIIYAVFLSANLFLLRRLHKTVRSEPSEFPGVSVIIPVRNEEQNILECLQSIRMQDYPSDKLEIIIVDDHSDDNTCERAHSYLSQSGFRFQIMHLPQNENGKKSAINLALSIATGEMIVTRDADTSTASHAWLSSTAGMMHATDADMLIAPVFIRGGDGFLTAFQQYENMGSVSLGAGMASAGLPVVCSGANLVYARALFQELNPYWDNLHFRSGDDMFLLKKAYRGRKKILATTNPAAGVFTPPAETFRKMLSQRTRWASKSRAILTAPIAVTGAILLLGNVASVVALISLFISGSYLTFGLLTLTIKLVFDFVLLFLSARMFKQKLKFHWFLPAFIFNTFFTPAVIVVSLCAKTSWKSRKV